MRKVQEQWTVPAWFRRAGRGLACVAACGWTWLGAQAQPAHDNFDNAEVLTGASGSFTGSSVGATREPGEPFHWQLSGGRSVWHTWTAPQSGMVLFDTRGSYFDTLLAGYTGSNVASLTLLANNDDFYALQSLIRFPAQAGGQYHIAVDGFQGDQGLYTLNWQYEGGQTNPPIQPPGPGEIQFSAATYLVSEGTPGYATIEVLTGGGHTTPLTVEYATRNGTAMAGTDYISASGTLTFDPGVNRQTFAVQILDNAVVNSNKSFTVFLTNPGGGGALGVVSNALVTIADDETQFVPSTAGQFQFSAGVYRVSDREGGTWYNRPIEGPHTDYRSIPGALITVTRVNGTTGRVLVDYVVTNAPGSGLPPGTNFISPLTPRPAVPFVDYVPTRGTLVFDDFQTSTNFLVSIRSSFFSFSNGMPEVQLLLTNPRPAPEENPTLIAPSLGLQNQALVQIVQSSVPGMFAFERLNYRVDEDTPYGELIFTVICTQPDQAVSTWVDISIGAGGSYWGPLNAGSDYARPGEDFSSEVVRLEFDANNFRRVVHVPINRDTLVEFNEEVPLVMVDWDRDNPVRPHPYASRANIAILFDDEPPGALDREWNPDGVSYTTPPFSQLPGANNQVFSVAVQPDGKTVLGGDFTGVNTVPRNRIARLNLDGSLDTAFLAPPNQGADGFVSDVYVYPSTAGANAGKMLIVGGFTSFNGVLRNGIARLNPDGSLDFSFAPGTGANAPISAVAVQADGKVVIGGEFTTFNEVPRSRVARLNPEGALDATFDPGLGADANVWAVALEPSTGGAQRIYLGGDFTFFDIEYRGHVARLNVDGSLDASFNPGGGANGPVYALAVQGNGRLLLGGSFSDFDSRVRVNLARLNVDGSLDLGYNPGQGANDPVYAITLTVDDKAYIGGSFTAYNGTRRMGLARVKVDGTLDTAFLDTAYNQFAGLPKTFSFEPNRFVNSIALQPDGNVMIGGSFTSVGGASARQIVNPERGANNTYTPVWTRQEKRPRQNIARLLGTWGTTGNTPNPPQGPGNVQYISDAYSIDENQSSIRVSISRIDGQLGTAGARAATTNRLAVGGSDYTGTAQNIALAEFNGFMRSEGYPGPVYYNVPILNDTLVEGDETLDLGLAEPFGQITLGGETILLGGALGRTAATLTIVDDDFNVGTIAFSAAEYVTNEMRGTFVLTLVRTNGSTGSVSVDYFTQNGSAVAGSDYTAKSGRITFNSGVTNRTIEIELIDDTTAEFDETFVVVLTNATGGATLPGGLPTSTTSAAGVIIDNDFPAGRLNFASTNFLVSEDAGAAVITVTRSGGNVGPLSVWVAATNGTARAGQDFVGVSNRLSWVHGETTPKTVTIPILDDLLVEGHERVSLRLYSNSLAGSLGNRSTSTLTIEDDDTFGNLAFSQAIYTGDENGTNLTLTVIRLGGSAGTVSVRYATADGSAYANQDYVPITNGQLTFEPGEISKTFSVSLIDNNASDGDRRFEAVLSNPGGGAGLGSPRTAIVAIVDDESFALPAGSLDTTFDTGTGPDRPVYTLALQPDAKLLVGGEFTTYNNIRRQNLTRLLPEGQIDTTFDVGAGVNDQLRAVTLQPDGRIVIGGFFTTVNNVNRSRIARLNRDGSLDTFFNPGAGADNPVFAIVVQPDGRVVVGGSFASFNGVTRPNLVRLNTNGTLHSAFDVGTGPNGPVYAIALQNDGKILIGGDFTEVNGLAYARIARLLPSGRVDTNFQIGSGANSAVRAIALQSDGKIVVGGSFGSFAGLPRNSLVRLERSGAVDAGFLDGWSGANDAVYAIALQADEKLLIGGAFTRFNDVTRNRLTRLNQDGTTDPSINFGQGANGFVAALVVQPDRRIVLGGGFTAFQGQPQRHLARVHGGSVAGAGTLGFGTPYYTVVEDEVIAVIDVLRRGGTVGEVSVEYGSFEGTAVEGQDYVGGSGALTFAQGEVLQTIRVPIVDDTEIEEPETAFLALLTASGGADIGIVPIATLTIVSDDCEVGFASPVVNVSESTPSGTAVVRLFRTGSTNGTVTVDYLANLSTNASRPATPGADFVPAGGRLTFLPGETNKVFLVSILDDGIPEGNEVAQLSLTGVQPGNRARLGLSRAELVIVDNEFAPGELSFASATYLVDERGTNAVIQVVRENGFSGLVSVRYSTRDGTAQGGLDYTPNSGVLAFSDGEVSKTFLVPILDDQVLEPNESVLLRLDTPTGGATLGARTNATLFIEDDESVPARFSFSAAHYAVAESGLEAVITVLRTNNLAGTATVDFATRDGLAQADLDYRGTNGTLVFLNDESVKTFTVPILGDQLGESDETVILTLLNPSTNAVVVLGQSILTISDVPLAGAVDATFNARWGADGPVYAAVFDANEQLYVAGEFGYLNGVAVNRVGRMTTNGTVDLSFNVGAGPNSVVYALGRSTNGLVIGGAFTNVSGAGRGHLARLKYDGTVDPVFRSAPGTDGDVLALAVQRDDKVVVGGAFRSAGGLPFNHLARFYPDGFVDVNFRVGAGANGTVRAVALQTGGGIVIGGAFTSVDQVPRGHVARLNEDGTLDATFGSPLGTDGPVYGLAVQQDGRVLIAGDFTSVEGVPRSRVARLMPDGTVDLSFDPGTGANALARAIDVQVDGKVVVVGDFTTFGGNTFHRVARLMPDGTLDTTFNPGLGANQRIYGLALGSSGQQIPHRAVKMPVGPFVVGGQDANISQFPYQVALLQTPITNPTNIWVRQFCGGSIINDRWILTAAHCADGSLPSDIVVAVGVTDLTQAQGGRLFTVDQIIVHPNWDPATLRHDVALLHLTESISFNSPNYVASPVRLVTPPDAAAGVTDPGVMATVTGWGNTSGTGGAAYPNVLQVAPVPITATSSFPPGQITPDMIMAGYPQGGISACSGDSGGPLVVTNQVNTILQAGVVSWGTIPCAQPDYPGVYARVSYFYDWIINQITGTPPGPGQSTSDNIAIVGDFTLFNGAPRNRIAVLDRNGANSPTFDPAAVPNNAVLALAMHTNAAQPELVGKLVVAGEFTSLVGVDRQYRVARLHADGTLDTNFNAGLGPDQTVRTMIMQPDGKVILGGLFTNVNATPRAFLARLNADGTLDANFNAGVGLNGSVYALAQQPDGKVLIGGVFTVVYGVPRNAIARVHTNGTVDAAFVPGTGINGPVNAILVQPDGAILVGGDFTTVNDVSRRSLARLLPSGALDPSFDPGPGGNGSVNALALTAGGQILVGGTFTRFNGANANRLVRLNANGAVDATFRAGLGADDFVNSITLQPDSKIVLGGAFVSFNGQLRNRVARLNPDGTFDPTISFGLGANNTVYATLVQPQDGKIVIGGAFTRVNGEPRVAVARLLGGANAGGGNFQFSTPIYSISEAGTNVTLMVVRAGGTAGAASVRVVTADGTATAPSDYTAVAATLQFNEAEPFRTVFVPVRDNAVLDGNRTFSASLNSPVGAGLGTPATASITLLDNDGQLEFSQPEYTVSEGGLVARVQVRRLGGALDPVTVECRTVAGGTATAGLDYLATNATLQFLPGVVVQTFDVQILDDTLTELRETIFLVLTNVAGPATLGRSSTFVTIVDNETGPGTLSFGASAYSVAEDGGQIGVSIVRAGGFAGAVSVTFYTINVTATGGADHEAAEGILTFAEGETNKTLQIRIFDDALVEGDEIFLVALTNVTGGATLAGPNRVPVTIEDNDSAPGSVDREFDPGAGANALVRALALQPDGRIVIGGAFSMFNGTNRNYLARLSSRGELDLTFNGRSGPNAMVSALAVQADSKVLAGGVFSAISGVNLSRLARLLENGEPDLSYQQGLAFDGSVNALSLHENERLVAGGSFRLPSRGVVQLRASGGLDTAFNPGSGASGPVHAVLALPDGRVVIAGAFTSVDGSERLRVARFGANGLLDTTFAPNQLTSGAVYCLAAQPDGKLILGGDFGLNGASNRVGLARLEVDGTLDASFQVGRGANGAVYALALHTGGRIFLGGGFTEVNGLPRQRFARLQNDGSVDLSFDPGLGANNTVYAMAVLPDGDLLLAGDFTLVGGVPRNRVAKITAAEAALRITDVAASAGAIELTVSVQPGRTYVTEASPDLGNPAAWTAISTNTAAGPTLTVTDTRPVGVNQQFYRVREASGR